MLNADRYTRMPHGLARTFAAISDLASDSVNVEQIDAMLAGVADSLEQIFRWQQTGGKLTTSEQGVADHLPPVL